MKVVGSKESGAFVEEFSLPPTGDGPLASLRFGVKDLIDVAGHRTGCGNPTWLATHPPATVHAVCVEQLLAAGAHCAGKTVTDEVAFSLLGQNHFYGTPLNPAAPDRVPGGSSSGSASAVACGLVDFALGTDTGGSVRVPASNCGVWGWRPTHGLVSVAGVMPFSPSLDTVGVLARNGEILQRAAVVLIGGNLPSRETAIPTNVYLLTDAFALADPDVSKALQSPRDRLQTAFGDRLRETSLVRFVVIHRRRICPRGSKSIACCKAPKHLARLADGWPTPVRKSARQRKLVLNSSAVSTALELGSWSCAANIISGSCPRTGATRLDLHSYRANRSAAQGSHLVRSQGGLLPAGPLAHRHRGGGTAAAGLDAAGDG